LLLTEFYPIAAIATTPKAVNILLPLCQSLDVTLYVPESIKNIPHTHVYTGSLKEHLQTIWHDHKAFIFCLATGAVVRLIAPLLEDKNTDPAIIVIDELGKYSISLCGGHSGGADHITRVISKLLTNTEVITGSSISSQLPAIDIMGKPFGWQRGSGDWNAVSAVISRGEKIAIFQDCGTTLWQNNLPENHDFILTNYQKYDNIKAQIYISAKNQINSDNSLPQVQWYPRTLWIGIGCERGTSKKIIAQAIADTFTKHNLSEKAIAGLATIDIKADEQGILEYCSDRHFPLITYSAEILKTIPVPTPSNIVLEEVGTASVAEASALKAAEKEQLLVTKEIHKYDQQKGAVTVAIAQAKLEYTDRKGEIYLVSTGPGNINQITPAGQAAIKQADAIIGYGLYIDLIQPLLSPHQIIEKMPITQEIQRAERAIFLAKWGLNVALISSGDIGIYAMGGLVLEQLEQQQWDGKKPAIQIFPGITALQSAASRVGTPLMHDFCAISLSDLLTPWPVIEKRLNAAAKADFVTALYNPKSQTRTQQIEIAQTIFLKYRHPETPVAIVKSAYREEEQIYLTNLRDFLTKPIDMLTVILIGNQSTRIYENWMITPRGYMEKIRDNQ
jgi:cobalt-precorrin 5A hydrolase / precorrin-3B C17-methyltransferase